jgi:putative transposase
VRDGLNSDRLVDSVPRQVYAALLDEEVYLCSWRTMYRILDEYQEVRERRNQLTHPAYTKPELLATAPNQLWSWDITKLLGPAKWTYFYLYVILDVFSRFVVGWMIAEREAASLAETLIAETCAKQHIRRDQLTLHAPIPQMTIHIPKRSSKRSNIAPISRTVLVHWSMRAVGPSRFSSGITTTIITPA